jgi:hypothetical protein
MCGKKSDWQHEEPWAKATGLIAFNRGLKARCYSGGNVPFFSSI